MLTKEDITNVFSQAYAQAALQENANMRLAADLYESLRPQINILDPSNVWDYIIIDKAKFDSDESVQLLVVLREVFFKTYIKKQLALLDEAISNKPNEVLDLWIQFYSDAAVNFREDFICILYHQRLKWDKDLEGIKKYLTLTRLMQEKRWADTYPFYEEIAGNSKLDKKTRVLAEVILAEIILYHYPQVTGAQKHLENADKLLENTDKLFSDYFITKKGWAEYYLKTGDPQKARNGFLEVITKQPGDFLAFNYVGDCFAAEGSLEYAESWYSDALQRNFLQTDTYKRLINLYADKKWFSEKQSQINNLLEKIKKRSWLFNMTKFLEKNVASQECFKDSGLYDSYRDIGSAWFANEDLEKAEEWYLKAVELQPTFTSAIVDIAYLKLHKQDPNKAKEYFLKALKQDPENFEIYWGLAYYYEQHGEKEEALKAYQQCLRLRPHWSDWVNNFIGNIHYSSNEYEKAASYYRKAIETNNDYPIYKQNLADALQLSADELVKKGNGADDAKAEELYQSAANIANTAEAWNNLGNFYYKKERWQQAIECFDNAIASNNAEPIYYENRGLVYEKINNIEKTEESYNKAIELDSKTGRYYNRLGLFYYNRKEYEKAIKYYLMALEREPEDPIFLDNICIAYEQANQRDKAEPYYLKLLQKEPDNDKIMNMLGVMYYKKGDYEKALSYYNMAIGKNAKVDVYHENLSVLFRSEGKIEEAIKALEIALELNPAIDSNWNNMGVLYFNLDNYDKALEYYFKAVTLKSDVLVYYENIGLAYEKKQFFTEAINNYQKALILNAKNSRILNAIGLVYYKEQQYANAIQYYRKAIEIDKQNWIYYTNLALALHESGFDDEAIKMYEKAVELNKNDYLNWNELGILYFQKENYDEAVKCYRAAIQLEPNQAVVYLDLALALSAQGKTDEALNVLQNNELSHEVKQQAEILLQKYLHKPS